MDIKDLKEEWTWERVLTYWDRRFPGFLKNQEPLFAEWHIYDSAFKDSPQMCLSWWRTEAIATNAVDLQNWLLSRPGTHSAIHYQTFKGGILKTLELLWDDKADRSKIVAILISASLFQYVQSHRRQTHTNEVLGFLYRLAEHQWNPSRDETWSRNSNTLLPEDLIGMDFPVLDTFLKKGFDSRLDFSSIIYYLASEHNFCLQCYKPVAVYFGAESDILQKIPN